MQWFKNLKISSRLILGFSTMMVFMGIIGFTGYERVSTMGSKLDQIYDHRLPSLKYLLEADRDLQQLLAAERSMIFANVESEAFKALLNEYEEKLEQSKYPISGPGRLQPGTKLQGGLFYEGHLANDEPRPNTGGLHAGRNGRQYVRISHQGVRSPGSGRPRDVEQDRH